MESIFETELMLRHTLQHLSISVALWLLVIAAILLDLWDGVYTAKRTHQRVHSHKLRVTVAKISEYWRLMLIGFIVDTIGILFPAYSFPYLSIVLCVGLIAVEAKSMFEHARKRKSSALQLQDIFKLAIDCATEADAKDVLRKFGDYLDKNEKKLNGENKNTNR